MRDLQGIMNKDTENAEDVFFSLKSTVWEEESREGLSKLWNLYGGVCFKFSLTSDFCRRYFLKPFRNIFLMSCRQC